MAGRQHFSIKSKKSDGQPPLPKYSSPEKFVGGGELNVRHIIALPKCDLEK